jgi:hypothetical protein
MQGESQKVHAFEIGAVDYISKPVHGGELIARIRVMLRLHDSQAEAERAKMSLVGQLHQAKLDSAAMAGELRQLRGYFDDIERERSMWVRLDAGGNLLECDDRFRARFRGDRFPDLLSVPDVDRDVWIGNGDERRCLGRFVIGQYSQPGY